MNWIKGISPITFPGLGLEIDPAAGFSVGPLSVNFYGVIIALGLILAVVVVSDKYMERRHEKV